MSFEKKSYLCNFEIVLQMLVCDAVFACIFVNDRQMFVVAIAFIVDKKLHKYEYNS